MRIYFHKLPQTLQQSLAPVWFVFGDEIWQKNTSLEQIKQIAKAQGFDEVIRFASDERFDWQDVIDEYHSLSLFSNKKLLEIEMTNGKFDEQAGKGMLAITKLLESGQYPDVMLVLHGPKLDTGVPRKKWFKGLDKLSIYLPLYELEDKALLGWTNQQARHYGIQLTSDASRLLGEYYQGNLPSLDQELQKLSILYPQSRIDAENLTELLNKQAKFNHFQLCDALLAGQLAKALDMLKQLQQEGLQPTQVIWALHREISQLHQMQSLQKRGARTQEILAEFKVWEKRKPLYQSALQQIAFENTKIALSRLVDADLTIKSSSDFNPFLLLADVCTTLFFGNTTQSFSMDYNTQ